MNLWFPDTPGHHIGAEAVSIIPGIFLAIEHLSSFNIQFAYVILIYKEDMPLLEQLLSHLVSHTLFRFASLFPK